MNRERFNEKVQIWVQIARRLFRPKGRVSRNIVGERELFPELMDQLYFLFCALMLISIIMTISSPNPIHSVFWLVVVFLQSFVVIIRMDYEFIGLVLVIVYVGAVSILFLFVIMMLDVVELKEITNFDNVLPIIALMLVQVILPNHMDEVNPQLMPLEQWFVNKESQVLVIGRILYNDFGLVLIVVSILLLVAMVGAIVLTLETNIITKRQLLVNQHQRKSSWI